MDSAIHRINYYPADKYCTVKSHVTVKALGLYNFIRGFGWAYKRRGVWGGGEGGEGLYGIRETNCKMTIHWIEIYPVDSNNRDLLSHYPRVSTTNLNILDNIFL